MHAPATRSCDRQLVVNATDVRGDRSETGDPAHSTNRPPRRAQGWWQRLANSSPPITKPKDAVCDANAFS
jgi:hypothetical protein